MHVWISRRRLVLLKMNNEVDIEVSITKRTDCPHVCINRNTSIFVSQRLPFQNSTAKLLEFCRRWEIPAFKTPRMRAFNLLVIFSLFLTRLFSDTQTFQVSLYFPSFTHFLGTLSETVQFKLWRNQFAFGIRKTNAATDSQCGLSSYDKAT